MPALDELVPMIERSNRWARIEGMTTETLPPEEHEYSFYKSLPILGRLFAWTRGLPNARNVV